MEQLVLVLLIAAISLINWLIEQSGKMRERRRLEKQRGPAPEVDPEPLTHQPREAVPPPFLEEWRTLSDTAEPAPPPPLPPAAVAPVVFPVPVRDPLPAVQLRPGPRVRPAKAPVPGGSALLPDLKSSVALRQAVLAREILGPPRGLASY